MKILIVEDEEIAALRLMKQIRSIRGDQDVLFHSESIRKTGELLSRAESPDLVFLDIHLEDGSGFDVIPLLDVRVPVIFTTAYDAHALEAFKVNSLDYLLKPVKEEELAQSFAKLDRLKPLSDIKTIPGGRQALKRLLVKIGSRLKTIELDEISLIQSFNRQVHIYLRNGVKYPLELTLDELERDLPPESFFRVSRSNIVSDKSIRQLIIWSKSRIRLELDTEPEDEVLVSAEKVARFKSWYTGKE